MFNNISWQGYGTFLAITIFLYYSFIVFRYYRAEVLHLLGKSKEATDSTERKVWTSLSSKEEFMPSTNMDAPESDPAATSLIDELQAFFEAGTNQVHTKESLLKSLELICKKYPAVGGTPFQYSVNGLILFLAEHSCSIHLSAEEVSGIW
jgi:hypothetical protein